MELLRRSRKSTTFHLSILLRETLHSKVSFFKERSNKNKILQAIEAMNGKNFGNDEVIDVSLAKPNDKNLKGNYYRNAIKKVTGFKRKRCRE